MKLQMRAVFEPEAKQWYKDASISVEVPKDCNADEFVESALCCVKALMLSITFSSPSIEDALHTYFEEYYANRT